MRRFFLAPVRLRNTGTSVAWARIDSGKARWVSAICRSARSSQSIMHQPIQLIHWCALWIAPGMDGAKRRDRSMPRFRTWGGREVIRRGLGQITSSQHSPSRLQYQNAWSATPGAYLVWIPGHWRWKHSRYIWVPGHYRRPPFPTARWIPGPLGSASSRLVLDRRPLE